MSKEYDKQIVEIMGSLKFKQKSNYQIGNAIYFAILESQSASQKYYRQGKERVYRKKESQRIKDSLEKLTTENTRGLNALEYGLEKAYDEQLDNAVANKKIFKMNFLYDALIFLHQKNENHNEIKEYLGEKAVESLKEPFPQNISTSLYHKLFVKIHDDIKDKYNIDLESTITKNILNNNH